MYKKILMALLLLAAIIIPVYAGTEYYDTIFPFTVGPYTQAQGTAECTLVGGSLLTPDKYLFRETNLAGAIITNMDLYYTGFGSPTSRISNVSVTPGFVYVQPYCTPTAGAPINKWFSQGYSKKVTFSITEYGNASKTLSGVVITLSNGQTNTTVIDGSAYIGVAPLNAGYTYSLAKTGYVTQNMQPLGGYGIFGGTIYDTLEVNTGFLPSGYVRTTVHTIDAMSGAQILGTTINLKDVQNSSWVNSTADADGQLIIDVLSGHTLDIYGSLTGSYTASNELGAVAGGDYYLPMYPPAMAAPFGYTNVDVYVREAGTGNIIQNAQVTVKLPTGATTAESTGTTGTASFVVPNSTVIIIGTTHTAYNGQSQSKSIDNTGTDVFITVTLSKRTVPTITVAPVVTDPATGAVITAVPTVDARTSSQKDTDMMAQLRDAGPGLISFCILAMFVGLGKMMMK